MANHSPLVSCICISHNHVDLLKRSLHCFLHQTYSNKELVVVYTDDNLVTDNYLNSLNNPSIKKIKVDHSLTLGEKRNLAINESSGFYFCVWDDDDWYGNKRIEYHVNQLFNTPFKCSVLARLFIYDSLNNQAYLSGKRWAWEQTMLCEKSVTKNPELRYANIERGEDSVFVYNLRDHNLLLTISDPSLYIYVYHGENTWNRKHWEDNIFGWGIKLPDEQSRTIEKILNGAFNNDEASELLNKIAISLIF